MQHHEEFYISYQKFFARREILLAILKLTLFSQSSLRFSKSPECTSVIIFRNLQSNIAAVSNSPEDMFTFDTQSLFCNVPYKRLHTTETTGLSRSWKKTLTAIGVSVSKLYVTFCGAAAKLKARVTVCCGS